MTRWIVAFTVLIFMAFLYPVAFADTETESDNAAAKNWDFSLAPLYLWAVSINGDMTVKGTKVDMDVPFSEIFDNLDGALTFHFEGVRNQSWGFFTDLNYIVLNPEDGDIDINYTQILGELAAFYRLIEQDLVIDGFGGLRYSAMDVELELINTAWDGIIPALLTKKFDILMSGMTIKAERNLRVNFVDPYIVVGQTVLVHKKHEGTITSYEQLNDPNDRVREPNIEI